jgi:hypothetical protein
MTVDSRVSARGRTLVAAAPAFRLRGATGDHVSATTAGLAIATFGALC